MIPQSAIRDTSLRDVVHELPLNRDVADHILSFTDKFVVPQNDPDLFWFTLGRETCNLYVWNHHCEVYACHAFGKSSKIARQIDMYRIFLDLKGNLDSMLCAYYGIDSIEEGRFRDRFDDIPMTHVFYNNTKMHDPPRPGERFKKYFSDYEREYIETFVSRFAEYLDNLDEVLDTIPYEVVSPFVKEKRRHVRTGIRAARRKLEKIDIKDTRVK